MIYESRYWKQPLVRSAGWLEKVLIKDGELSERDLASAEREMFIGFYAVRKLLETFKLSEATKHLTYDLTFYPVRQDASVDYFNRSDIHEHYEFDKGVADRKDVGFICNQVIHSFVFVLTLAESGAEGAFLASDTMRHRRLYFIPLEHIVHLFRTVGRDYPAQQNFVRDEKTGQWKVIDDALLRH
ncbi:hypothetical protein [Pseudomonas sp. PDM25]|uniref:hypothetical protein n=1 Tax=Pseudomonas sp. PDM25 TaxID=2854772 RepID=UPI001C48D7C1|nr:hypothetical protein [Pseudomonas sp. PDM25]MBV7510072.1 hypothetical protein [Pseudomonas sp. PDM25]